MLMTDGEIREALAKRDLGIENFSEECLEAASYDMRVGSRALLGGEELEIDVEARRGIVLDPGQFALLTTYEVVKCPADIAGHIGLRSYYSRKALQLLAGLQVDPGFEGSLVLGLYNAAPRRLTLDYLAPVCTVEFHRLARPAEHPYVSSEEQKRSQIPRVDKDYMRVLETETLSELAASLRSLTQNVASLTNIVNKWVVPILVGTLLAVVAFGLAALVTR